MTAPSLRDTSPDGPRAALLDSLAFGFSLPRALSAAFGGRIPVTAWRELGEMRRVGSEAFDGEVAKACEEAEARAKEKADDGATRGEEDAGAERRLVGDGQGSNNVQSGWDGARTAGRDDHGHRLQDGSGRSQTSGEEEGGEAARSPAIGSTGMVEESRSSLDGETLGPEERVADEFSSLESDEDFTNDYARIRAEARARFGPGRLGLLKWIDMRGQMMRPALHAIEPLWLDAFGAYYDSGKLIMVARKGLRAGGSSSACPALVRCALFADRHLDAGTIGVVPIMSATRDEADGRFVTIRAYLRACGLAPPEKSRSDDDVDGRGVIVPQGGISATFKSKRSQSGGGVILLNDAHGHEIEFRILPALVRHGVGYTGVAGFADESDLWPNDPEHHVNPAERIFDRISERFTTTYNQTSPGGDPGAEMLIFSASYNGDSAHKRLVDEGDTPLQHVMRLGAAGAARDEDARRSLAVESDDPRLLAPGDPMSPDLPAWVYNPGQAPISKCYAFSKGSVTRMLGLYGGRAAENASGSAGLAGLEFPVQECALDSRDRVVGLAPSPSGWGRVEVTMTDAGFVVVDEEDRLGGPLYDLDDVSVLACATDQARAVEAERIAWLSGRNGAHLPPVAPQSIYDGGVLRLSPLRTLYERGRLRHAHGLTTLEAALRSHHDGSPRDPRLEALLAAVMRLVSCYPWLATGAGNEAPWRGPGMVGTLVEKDPREADMTRRLGLRG